MPDVSQMTERQSISDALLSDVNLNLVREHIDTAIKRRGYDGPTEPEEYLIEQDACCATTEEHSFQRSRVLWRSAASRTRYVSVCGIDIAQFSGPRPNTNDLVLSRQIRRDLMTIIDRAVDLLWARTEHRTHCRY
jgi:hypothetical protein